MTNLFNKPNFLLPTVSAPPLTSGPIGGGAGPAPGFSQATTAQLQAQSQQAPRQEQQQQNFAAAVQQLNGKENDLIYKASKKI